MRPTFPSYNIPLILSILSILLLPTISSCNNDDKDYHGNYYRILVGDKYGFIDKYGKVTIEPQYDHAHRYFYGDVCFVTQGDEKFIIERKGNKKVTIPDSIEKVYKFIGGYSRATGAKGEGILSSKGNMVINAIYPKTSVNKDGENVYFLIEGTPGKNNRDWFMADSLGNQIGQKYDSILGGFSQGMAPVKLDGKWGYADTEGNLVIQPVFDRAHPFSEEGIARVTRDYDDRFINKEGNYVCYDLNIDKALTDFRSDRAAVIVNGEKILIDKQGNTICTVECDEIFPFDTYSLATVIRGGKAYKIDNTGNVVLESKFDNIFDFHNGVAFAQDNNRYGAIDLHGNIIVEPAHDQYHPMEGREVLVFSDNINGRNCFYYYDYQGNLIWQDINPKKVPCPTNRPQRKDFVTYFDANIATLDPIEGIYYATNKGYHQDAKNPKNIELSYTKSDFMAIARKDPSKDEFSIFMIDGTGRVWTNKFVKEGDTNNYTIVSKSKNKDSNYSTEGKVTISDPNLFDFRLEQAPKDPNTNLFATYEFIREYPPVSEYLKYKRSQWTGTGFAIADGIIATTYDVTNGARTIEVKGVDGNMRRSYKAYVIASDKALDLSLIKIVDRGFENFGPIPYYIDNKTAKTEEEIFVWGYPSNPSHGSDIQLYQGIISSSSGYIGNESMYLISAPTEPLSSGSPVFNEEGNIIGIICEKHSDAAHTESFAIKSTYLLGLIKQSKYKMALPLKSSEDAPSKKDSQSDIIYEVKCFVYQIECSSK